METIEKKLKQQEVEEKKAKKKDQPINQLILAPLSLPLILLALLKARSQQRLDKLAQRRKSREEVKKNILGKKLFVILVIFSLKIFGK